MSQEERIIRAYSFLVKNKDKLRYYLKEYDVVLEELKSISIDHFTLWDEMKPSVRLSFHYSGNIANLNGATVKLSYETVEQLMETGRLNEDHVNKNSPFHYKYLWVVPEEEEKEYLSIDIEEINSRTLEVIVEKGFQVSKQVYEDLYNGKQMFWIAEDILVSKAGDEFYMSYKGVDWQIDADHALQLAQMVKDAQ